MADGQSTSATAKVVLTVALVVIHISGRRLPICRGNPAGSPPDRSASRYGTAAIPFPAGQA